MNNTQLTWMTPPPPPPPNQCIFLILTAWSLFLPEGTSRSILISKSWTANRSSDIRCSPLSGLSVEPCCEFSSVQGVFVAMCQTKMHMEWSKVLRSFNFTPASSQEFHHNWMNFTKLEAGEALCPERLPMASHCRYLVLPSNPGQLHVRPACLPLPHQHSVPEGIYQLCRFTDW